MSADPQAPGKYLYVIDAIMADFPAGTTSRLSVAVQSAKFYGFSVTQIMLVNGKIQFQTDNMFPPEEMASFDGSIVPA